jgi:hypothetical protein
LAQIHCPLFKFDCSGEQSRPLIKSVFDLYSRISISKAKIDGRKGEKNAVKWKEYPLLTKSDPLPADSDPLLSMRLKCFAARSK